MSGPLRSAHGPRKSSLSWRRTDCQKGGWTQVESNYLECQSLAPALLSLALKRTIRVAQLKRELTKALTPGRVLYRVYLTTQRRGAIFNQDTTSLVGGCNIYVPIVSTLRVQHTLTRRLTAVTKTGRGLSIFRVGPGPSWPRLFYSDTCSYSS